MLINIAIHSTSFLPGWLQTPEWLWPVSRAIGHFVKGHLALGLFLVIFAEELGIPLPAPGDATITYGGYQTTTGGIPFPLAYLAVVSGATLGSFCLYWLSRRYGHPFFVRFGPYIGLHADRLERAEAAFKSWGPWAIIIGRHIPGFRIVLSAFAGAFEFPRRLFVLCVLISSSIWAAIFLELGRMLGRNSRYLFRVFPAHLIPFGIVLIALLWALWVGYEHTRRRRREARRRARAMASRRSDAVRGLPPKAEGRTAKM